jgi:molybdate transport system substrate-binding protein
MVRRLSRILSFVLAAGLFLAGCGDDTATGESATPATTVTGEITVFAATSLTVALFELGKKFETAHPGTKVRLNFGASSALVQQLTEGATADVFASADTNNMDKVAAAGLARTPTIFARNRLVIVTKPGNPAKIRGLADLTDAGVIALCGAQVPCGAYAAEALAKAGVTIDESQVTRGQNVSATLAAVAEGDAVAGVVYASDTAGAASKRVSAVAIPSAQNVVAAYPIARLRGSTNDATARAFVTYVRSAAGQRVLERSGFLKA